MQGLRGASVVVVGASSGIGLATALAFARRGARVVLAARRAGLLEEAARACEAAGAPAALAVPTDIADPAQAEALAAATAARFGGIDVWVNMAGVTAAGPFERIPLEAQRRIVEVNLIGTMNGAWAALPAMLRRGRGVIVNMASLAGRVPHPFLTAYTASKFGVAGFTEALRQELAPRSGIAVCGVYPGVVDTPIPHHAANYTGRTLRPPPPVMDPEHIAEGIVGLALRPRRAWHPGAHHLAAPAYALMPEAVGRLVGRVSQWFLLRSGPEAPATTGAVLAPMAEGAGIRGHWRPAGPPPWLALGAAAGLAGAAALLLGRRPSPWRLHR